jgi:hypothetical protein
MANLNCVLCSGRGYYSYDENHGKFCENCCLHNKGFWLLKEHYGKNNGRYCCLAGCGFTIDKDELPKYNKANMKIKQ